ncbi:MAG: response regulator [Candidatus Nitrosocosmicus sp.]|nr:response regulator [Candidatus Nitrosocosmicus sp.]MDN5867705.1 response regulator [Candidatus Nitrosocosmicus sp.]
MSPPLSIMIVEDERDLSHLYKLYLARLGIDSISFSNPLIALDHYQQNQGRYALTLLDWDLPAMNGLELANGIRKINSKVPILLLTGYYIKDMLLKDEFREAKISEILLKPIRLSDLGACIIKLCS